MNHLDPSHLPTVDEILSGHTQAGVQRPRSSFADDENDSVMRVGSTVVPSSVSQHVARPSRWRAIVQLLRIIFGRRGER